MRNQMLDVENEKLQEENKELKLEKEALIEDGDNKVSAMGQDMGNLIHKYKNLKIKKKKKIAMCTKNVRQTPSNLGATTGCGYEKMGKN